jgi:type IV pilus assembly protein PilA
MRSPLRSSGLADERGFSLAELLVCVLIFGIMAAIALPAWLDQRAKGQDAEATLTIRTTAIALQTYWTNEGTYDATPAQLEAIEPSLADTFDLRVTGDEDSYAISEDSADATVFTLTRDDNTGRIARDCTNHGYGLCRSSPDANGNFW